MDNENNFESGSIDDDIANAFDELEGSGVDEPNEAPEPSATSEIDDDGQQAEEAQPSQEEGQEAEAEEAPEEEAQPVQAPEHWSEEDKAIFNNSPKDVQEWALRRHKEMESAANNKMMEAADIRKSWEPIEQMFAPHMEQLAQQGQTPVQVIQRWAQVEQNLAANPVETIQYLAQQYGVDLNSNPDAQQGNAGNDLMQLPEFKQISGELNELRNQINTQKTAEYNQRLTTAQDSITTFAEAKTEAGELAHPYFSEVMDEITVLAKAEREAGREVDLGKLYEKAVWSNTSTREKLQSAQRQAAESKRQKEARAKAAKAKKAASNIPNNEVGDAVPSERSLDDELADAWDKMS